MKKTICYKMFLFAVCCLLLGKVSVSAYSGTAFDDVPKEYWAYDDVMAMADAGIVNGVGHQQYRPFSKVTYAMFYTVIGRIAFEDKVEHENGETWYSPYVQVLEELGILDDMGVSYGSIHNTMNRYDMAKVIHHCLRYFEVELLPYDTTLIKDYDKIPAQYAEDVSGVFASGIIKGYSDGCFYGENIMNRAELAAAANRFQTLLNESQNLYQLTIETTEGGTIPAGLESEINGLYPAGACISIAARPMPEYDFVQWVSSNGGAFGDQALTNTAFVMPDSDTVITAVFQHQ